MLLFSRGLPHPTNAVSNMVHVSLMQHIRALCASDAVYTVHAPLYLQVFLDLTRNMLHDLDAMLVDAELVRQRTCRIHGQVHGYALH